MDYHLILYVEDLLTDKNLPKIVIIESLKISYANKFGYTNVLALFKITEDKIQEVEKKVLEEFNKTFTSHNSPIALSNNIHYFSGNINNMISLFSNTILKIINCQPNKETTPVAKNNDIVLNRVMFNNKIDEYLEYQVSIVKKEMFDKKQNYPNKIQETQIKILEILDYLSKSKKYSIVDFYKMVSVSALLKYLTEFYKINNIEYNLSIENTSLVSVRNNIINFIKPKITTEQSQQFTKILSKPNAIIKNYFDLITKIDFSFQLDSKEKMQTIYQLIEYLCENNQITKTLYDIDKKYTFEYIHDSVCIDEPKITFELLKIKICIINVVNTRMLIKKLNNIEDINYINLYYNYLNSSYQSLSKIQ